MDDVAGSADAAAETLLPAEYEQAFREANDRIRAAGKRLRITRPLPFVCECGRRDCSAVIHVRIEDYDRVRCERNRFLYLAGHEQRVAGAKAIEVLDGAVVVERDPNAETPRLSARELPPRPGRFAVDWSA